MKPILLPLLLSLVTQQAAAFLPKPLPPHRLIASLTDFALGGNATFDQYIDHANPSLGTFKQRFWYNTSNWRGPGSPVYLFTPGETSADEFMGALTQRSLMGRYAFATGGATIMIEHRYYGESYPFSILDNQNLTYLTLRNSLADLAHFARTVELPFDQTGQSSPENAPWIFVGGSYGGMLSAWLQQFEPGVFWASHASSAPVQAFYNFWNYFTPIERAMPENCSADALLIADHVTAVYGRGNKTEMHELQDMFGLAEVEHYDDFAAAVGVVFSGWQFVSPASGYDGFFQMCDTIEGARKVSIDPVYLNGTNTTTVDHPPNSTTTTPTTTTMPPWYGNHTSPPPVPASGIGLERALPNFAAWYKNTVVPNGCAHYHIPEWADPLSVGCFNSHNASSPMYTDLSIDGPWDRPWFWLLCNEPFAFWQNGPPPLHHGLMSRVVSSDYFQRQCALMFPPGLNGTKYGSADGVRTPGTVNQLTGGWNYTNTTRVLWTVGEFDPWRYGTVASPIRPGGPLASSPANPVFVIPGASHCIDLVAGYGYLDPRVQDVQQASMKLMVKWVAEYMVAKGNQTSRDF